MATVTAFSPFSFYAAAHGGPLEDAATTETYNLPLPEAQGLSLIERKTGAPSTGAATAIHATIAARRQLIASVQNGEIPPLSVLTSRSTLPLFHTHPPLGELHASSARVLDLLNLGESLATEAHASSRRACPMCDTIVWRYRTPSEIYAEISPRSEGEQISVDAIGSQESLSRWTSDMGFSISSTSETNAVARIDSLRCDQKSFEIHHSVLRAALSAPGVALRVSSAAEAKTYAMGGWCDTCETLLLAPTLSIIKESLSRGEGEALWLMARDRTLRETLSLPLETLAPEGYLENTPETTLAALRAAGLLSLRLHDKLQNLSPQSLGALMMILTFGERSSADPYFLVDLPLSLYSAADASTLITAARELLTGSTGLWKTDEPVVPAVISLNSPKRDSARNLGELRLATGDSIPLMTNEITLIAHNRAAPHARTAREIFSAISGEKSSSWSYAPTCSQAVEFVECFVPSPATPKLIAHEIGALDPLTSLFAASHHARTLGLSAKDFSISQKRVGPHVCATCRGAGVIIQRPERLSPPMVSPCSRCWGSRFRGPVRDVTFKGRTLWQILNTTIDQNASIFRALPKMSHVLDLAEIVSLGSLPLGTPIACLSDEQRRGVAMVRAILRGTVSTPVVVVLEDPFVGLSQSQVNRLNDALKLPALAGRVSLVATSSTLA